MNKAQPNLELLNDSEIDAVSGAISIGAAAAGAAVAGVYVASFYAGFSAAYNAMKDYHDRLIKQQISSNEP